MAGRELVEEGEMGDFWMEGEEAGLVSESRKEEERGRSEVSAMLAGVSLVGV